MQAQTPEADLPGKEQKMESAEHRGSRFRTPGQILWCSVKREVLLPNWGEDFLEQQRGD